MNTTQQLEFINEYLLNDMPQFREQARRFDSSFKEQRMLMRSLMNVRPPKPLSEEFLKVQNDFLRDEAVHKGIVSVSELTPIRSQMYLWQGDITRLAADAIVNAANSALLGCFIPCHGCIDNAIHSAAGLELRNECNRIMKAKGCEEETGKAVVTSAYNLPCKKVIHTVGPIIEGKLTDKDRILLADCYRSCLDKATENNLDSIAFCCISTGEFRFPQREAALIAIKTVSKFIEEKHSRIKVIFNVFKDEDLRIYKELLG